MLKPRIKVSNLHEIGLLLALIIVLVIFSLTTENFFTQRNFLSILRSASYVGLIAFPMTFVLITSSGTMALAVKFGYEHSRF